MTPGSVDPVAPVLVLGAGNSLLTDDGAGLVLLADLESSAEWPREVEFVDGGTQGIALLGVVAGRRRLLVLDAIQLGAEPGTVHCLDIGQLRHFAGRRPATPHESNVTQLLATAELMGDLPPQVTAIGIEPATLKTGYGLSPAVRRALPEALRLAALTLRAWLDSAPVSR